MLKSPWKNYSILSFHGLFSKRNCGRSLTLFNFGFLWFIRIEALLECNSLIVYIVIKNLLMSSYKIDFIALKRVEVQLVLSIFDIVMCMVFYGFQYTGN